MEEKVEHIIQAIKENPSDCLVGLAKDLANYSLETFRGTLLEKALMISAAVASFDAELQK